jgi:hypothetical protein
LNKENKVLKRCIEMGFLSKADDFRKVRMVDVSVDTKEALKDILDGG